MAGLVFGGTSNQVDDYLGIPNIMRYPMYTSALELFQFSFGVFRRWLLLLMWSFDLGISLPGLEHVTETGTSADPRLDQVLVQDYFDLSSLSFYLDSYNSLL